MGDDGRACGGAASANAGWGVSFGGWSAGWAGFPFLEDLGKILSREVDCYV